MRQIFSGVYAVFSLLSLVKKVRILFSEPVCLCNDPVEPESGWGAGGLSSPNEGPTGRPPGKGG